MSERTAGAVDTLAELLQVCQERTERMLRGWPSDQRLVQLAPGKATPLWLAGHLAYVADLIGRVYGLGLEPLFQQAWAQRFAPTGSGGQAITTVAAVYPEWDDVVRAYGDVMSDLHATFLDLDDSELGDGHRGAPPEHIAPLIPTLRSTAMFVSMHDSHHRGQLALLLNHPR